MFEGFKTLRKNVTNMNASSAINPKQAHASNAKTLNVKSTIILNVPERRRSIWSSSTYKKSSIWSFAKSMNLLKLQGKSSTKRRKIEIKLSNSHEWLRSTLKHTKLQYSLWSWWKSFPPNPLFKLSKTMKRKKRKINNLKLSSKQMKTLSRKSSSNYQRLKRFLSLLSRLKLAWRLSMLISPAEGKWESASTDTMTFGTRSKTDKTQKKTARDTIESSRKMLS